MSAGKSISLYIHIPFCRSKCIYCDFYSIPEPCAERPVPDSYIDALEKELYARCGDWSPESWRTVYIGGGTPSLLKKDQLVRLMDAVRAAVPGGVAAGAEVTMEANPADINEDFLVYAAAAGINRLSVGIQCCDEKVLSLLGRRADSRTADNALSLISNRWIPAGRRFSGDLIAGLPKLSDESFIKGIDRLVSSGADHISLYSLMIEEGTPLWGMVERKELLCPEEDAERQWFLGRDRLEQAGLLQYEVSNFARKGFESRHNCVYWHMDDFIGIGAGASGTVGNSRWTGIESVEGYVSGWLEETSRPEITETLDEDTMEYEFLMMGFRLREGVSSAEYRKRFGRDLAGRIGASDGLFHAWEQRNLTVTGECDGDVRYALNGEGIMLQDRFLEEL